ncbi:Cytochrome P450 monooxygenase paxP [Colletotrichum higginsianum]|nr:Cytochrome P450 monooxygenase paxP [Colletotrichum higginsianum]
MSRLLQYGCALLAFGVCWLIQRRLSRRRYDLDKLPFVRFEENDTPERYVADSRSVLHSGYVQYLKNGIPFRMRNPVDPDHPQVILPFKYLNEVKMAPESVMSFQRFSRQAFLLDYINAPKPTAMAPHIVRGDLNKHLGTLTGQMGVLARQSINEGMPKCNDWTPFQPYFLFAHTVARVTSMALASPELSANEEWRNIMVTSTITLMQTAQEVRRKYPRHWRWVVPWVEPGAKRIYEIRKRCAELLAPSYQNRLARMASNEKPLVDGIQWLMSTVPDGKKGLLEIADEQLFLSMASIHSSSASTLSFVYDLMDRPELMDEILQEIRSVRGAKNGSSEWTKRDLDQLVKLDSFMKESQRYYPVGLVTVQRSNLRPYTFSDGLTIPANTQCCFLNYELNHDPEVYEDPETFDAYRFLRLRETGDPHKHHFAYVSEDSINFGAGTYSCPGRHFAGNEIKLILCELLLGYEMKWPEGGSRPPTMYRDFSSNPDPGVDILFRERKC